LGPSKEIALGIEAFVRGFTFTRSFTHPYVGERVGPLWRLRDGPRKSSEDYRREEWIACGVPAAEVDATVRKQARGRFCICAIRAIDEPDESIRSEYRSLGYRLGGTESLMMHRMQRIPNLRGPCPVQRVLTPELADQVAKASGRRQALTEHLTADAPQRLYAVVADGRPVGWLKSITAGDCTWVANVFVHPKFRRRGIGKAMLCKMLRDDRAHGSKRSYLLASHAGALLYPNVGYETLGQLLLYTPVRQKN